MPDKKDEGIEITTPTGSGGLGSIRFQIGPDELMRFDPDGTVVVRGEVVASNQEVYSHFTKWLAMAVPWSSKRRVVIESPYAGDVEKNLRYLRACMRDCLLRGEAPFASHGLYTQEGVLRDEVPEDRKLGIAAGFAWRDVSDATVVYEDLGVSSGMLEGIADAKAKGRPVEFRILPGWAIQ
jgi:hypothetical protein